MEALNQLSNINVIYVVSGLFVIIECIKFVISRIEWIMNTLGLETKWMRKKREDYMLLKRTVEELDELKKQRKIDVDQSIKHDQKLDDRIGDVISLLQEHIKSEDKRTVAILRSTLYGLHAEFVQQGFVTPSGLTTFDECGKVYEAAGGNDVYHDKLRPEVIALPIKTE